MEELDIKVLCYKPEKLKDLKPEVKEIYDRRRRMFLHDITA